MKRPLGPRTSAVLALLGLHLLTAGCANEARRPVSPSPRRAAPAHLRIRVADAGRAAVREVRLEDYVRASIISEFAPPGGDAAVVERVLEVQAVLSRTYALSHLARHARDGYDLCDTTHCQLYDPSRLRTSRWAPAAADAVRRTAGAVLWFDEAPAAALFHADCGGHTSTPSAIWGGAAPPYLRGRADDGPAEAAHSTWQYDAPAEAVRVALNADARTSVGSRLSEITVVERDDAGRAVRVLLEGQHARVVRGEIFRDVLTRAFGARTIRSTWFTVRRERARWLFEGRGFGHGAGLCQAGAFARIRAGASPSAVLLRYFPGTRLVVLG